MVKPLIRQLSYRAGPILYTSRDFKSNQANEFAIFKTTKHVPKPCYTSLFGSNASFKVRVNKS